MFWQLRRSLFWTTFNILNSEKKNVYKGKGGNKLNKNKLSLLKDTIIGFLILAIIGYAFIWLLRLLLGYVGNFIKSLSNMDAVVIVALITGSVSILGVVISSIVSKLIEYQQKTKRYLYEKKEEPYAEFIEMVYKLQDSEKGNKKYCEKEVWDDTISFSKKLTLWGSSKVIKKWLDFRKKSQEQNDNITDILFTLEEIIFEIRKDMGQKNGLKQGDILKFFVNDVKNYLPKDKKK